MPENDDPLLVVDLCSSPGSWSQYLSRNHNAQVIAVDIKPMKPLNNVEFILGDITVKETAKKVIERMGGRKADLVVCDGAPPSNFKMF